MDYVASIDDCVDVEIKIEDHIFMIMKVLLENKSYTISKDRKIIKDEK